MMEIELREIDGARAAFVSEWDIPVWSIIAGVEETHGDLRRTAQRLNVPVGAIRSALRYAAGHRREIEVALKERPGAIAKRMVCKRPCLFIADLLRSPDDGECL